MSHKYQQGYILSMVLLLFSVIIIMTYALSHTLITQQKSVNNYEDMKLAQNYAYEAMMYAESYTYQFDLKHNLESPNISNMVAANGLFANVNNVIGANCTHLRRAYVFSTHAGVSSYDDKLCENGVCFKNSHLSPFNSEHSWEPWTILSSSTYKARAPCDSYIYHKQNNEIPLVDDRNNRYSIPYIVNDKKLCANPRFIIEPINLDFRGVYEIELNNNEYDISYFIFQKKSMVLYKANKDADVSYPKCDSAIINSARLYRITVVAYGKSGDTRALLQEVVLINNYDENLRISDDRKDNMQNRIIRLSTKWITND